MPTWFDVPGGLLSWMNFEAEINERHDDRPYRFEKLGALLVCQAGLIQKALVSINVNFDASRARPQTFASEAVWSFGLNVLGVYFQIRTLLALVDDGAALFSDIQA
ncbi:hypothetical protein Q8W37_20310 [Shimia thalassica]|nr:hypothetical protein [Shimia thalassica]